MTGCVCKGPGYCERHKCNKTPHFYKLCKTREDYFQLWERGSGPGQSNPAKQFPSFFTQAKNFAGAVVDFVADGMALVDEKEHNRRLSICKGSDESLACEMYDNGRCAVCGCNMFIKAKARTFQCPIGRWGDKKDRAWNEKISTITERAWAEEYMSGNDNPDYTHQSPLSYTTTEDLTRASITLSEKLPNNLSGIAGIPRSGMIPASIISTMRHIPLYEVSKQYGLRLIGGGWRSSKIEKNQSGVIAVVDDTIYSGRSIKSASNQMIGHDRILCAAFVRPGQHQIVDFYGELLPSPHILEWNIFNSCIVNGSCMNPRTSGGAAMDLDGVLCEECPIDGDDTERGDERYRQWILSAQPKRTCKMISVPLIVSFRLERFRAETEQWLANQGIKCDRLILDPSQTFKGRDFNAARHKGEAYRESKCSLFIESCDCQAREIHAATERPVLCLESGVIYQKEMT